MGQVRMEEQMGGTEGRGRLVGQRGGAGWWDRGAGQVGGTEGQGRLVGQRGGARQVRMEEQRGGAG